MKKLSISIFLILLTISVMAEIPIGHILRPLKDMGDSWVDNINWLPEDSGAIWIEHPPNNSNLARLVIWTESRTKIVHPVGVCDYRIGIVDSALAILFTAAMPADNQWNNRRVHVCYPSGNCRIRQLPLGQMPGLIFWDGVSDTFYLEVCTAPDAKPSTMKVPFRGEISSGVFARSDSIVMEVGSDASSMRGACYESIDLQSPVDSSSGVYTMEGEIPSRDIDFIIDSGEFIIEDGDERFELNLPQTAAVIDIKWNSSGDKAIISTAGNPCQLMILNLVWPN